MPASFEDAGLHESGRIIGSSYSCALVACATAFALAAGGALFASSPIVSAPYGPEYLGMGNWSRLRRLDLG